MAFIILNSADSKELARYPLDGPVLLGRSPDCDVRLHDILASREHCSLERHEGGWIVTDLKSRNGTKLNGHRVVRQALNHNDTLIVGRTRITFRDEILLDTSAPTREFSPSERPANPFEALSATVVDFSVAPKFEPPVDRPIIRPMPRPMPVANRSAQPEAADFLHARDGDSSPTWATKRISSASSPRLMAVEEDLGPPPQPQIPLTPWTRRTCAMIAEVLLAGAITGATVVGIVAALTH